MARRGVDVLVGIALGSALLYAAAVDPRLLSGVLLSMLLIWPLGVVTLVASILLRSRMRDAWALTDVAVVAMSLPIPLIVIGVYGLATCTIGCMY